MTTSDNNLDDKPNNDNSWAAYYDKVANLEAHNTLLFALKQFAKEEKLPTLALDLGCGAGRDSKAMLEAGWSVIAIDKEADAIAKLLADLDGTTDGKLRAFCQSLESTDYPRADLINAGMCLPFLSRKSLMIEVRRILLALRRRGRFSGHFIGPDDSWAQHEQSSPNRISAFNEQELLSLFSLNQASLKTEIELFTENKSEGTDAAGNTKIWHIFEVVAKVT
ncbi:class I SAM-dependent methyltransferase [soil metagenome]